MRMIPQVHTLKARRAAAATASHRQARAGGGTDVAGRHIAPEWRFSGARYRLGKTDVHAFAATSLGVMRMPSRYRH